MILFETKKYNFFKLYKEQKVLRLYYYYFKVYICTTCCTRTCQKAVHSYKLYTHKINLTSQTFHTFLSVKNRLNFRIVYLEGLAT